MAAPQFSGEELEAQSSELLPQGDMVSKYWYLSNVAWAWCIHLLFQLISGRAKIPKSLTLKSILFLSITLLLFPSNVFRSYSLCPCDEKELLWTSVGKLKLLLISIWSISKTH